MGLISVNPTKLINSSHLHESKDFQINGQFFLDMFSLYGYVFPELDPGPGPELDQPNPGYVFSKSTLMSRNTATVSVILHSNTQLVPNTTTSQY